MIYWSNKQTEIIHLLPFPLARRTNTATVQTFSASHYVMLQRRKTSIWAPWDSWWLTNSLPPSVWLLNNSLWKESKDGWGSLQQEYFHHQNILQLFKFLGNPYFLKQPQVATNSIIFSHLCFSNRFAKTELYATLLRANHEDNLPVEDFFYPLFGVQLFAICSSIIIALARFVMPLIGRKGSTCQPYLNGTMFYVNVLWLKC